MAIAVLDSSVILAALNDEAGAAAATDLLPTSLVSTVNLGEVVTKLVERGEDEDAIRETLALLECEFVPFDVSQAVATGLLHAWTRGRNISLGDRACLALGMMRDLPVYTADRPWAALDLPLDIRLIR